MDLRRRVRHPAQTDVAPRHVFTGRVEVCDEKQVCRAVVPETGIDAPDVERLVRGLRVDDERLDSHKPIRDNAALPTLHIVLPGLAVDVWIFPGAPSRCGMFDAIPEIPMRV